MTTEIDIVNRALQVIGTRTTVTQSEFDNQTTNEAIQAQLVFDNTRDDLLRMAPWNCALRAQNLTYITSTPGTPENTSPATQLWERGQPMPPWAYEYQYPVDCLRPCWIIPAQQTGFTGTPITTAVIGGVPVNYTGAPVRFKVMTDTFYPVTAAAISAGGTGFAVGDIITLPGTTDGATPIGAPVQLQVATLSGSAIATVTVISQVPDTSASAPLGGSYFTKQTNPVAQDVVTRDSVEITTATGATFTLTYGSLSPQRVIVTNQEYATLAYIHRVTDPNIMDTLFQSAWISNLGANLVMALTGDKSLANMLIAGANKDILEARMADGNEGLTINDITPDWIRGRGYNAPDAYGGQSGPYSSFDWGGLLPGFV